MRRALGLVFFGVLARDVIRVGMLILMGLIFSEGLPSILILLLASTSMLAAFSYANVVNDIYDLELDKMAKSYRPLPDGRYTVREAKLASVFFLGMALVTGTAAVIVSRSLPLAVLLYVTPLASHLYSWPPVRFKARSWLGVISISLIYLCPVLMGYFAGGASPRTSPLILLMFLAIFLASATKDFEDVEVDSSMGVRTPPVIHGIERTAWLLKLAGIGAAAVACGFGAGYFLAGSMGLGLFSVALLPSFAVYTKRISRYHSSGSNESLIALVQGCLLSMYVWPAVAAVVVLLLPSWLS
jgi:geranylgeranylglycerol-phosphate geranylgeranyltransferase